MIRGYYPGSGDGWQRSPPADLGMSAGQLDEAVSFAQSHEIEWPRDPGKANVTADPPEHAAKLGPFRDRGGPAGIVLRSGCIVAEWGDLARVDLTFSATKSYIATLAGLAVDRGLIRNVNDRVSDYVHDDTFASSHNGTITWRHLLQQTSEWEGTLFDKPDTVDWNRQIDDSPTPARTGRQQPGDFWEYNDVRVNATSLALMRVWGEPLPEVLRREVMEPIGASDTWEWHGYRNSYVDLDGQRVQSVSGGAHWGGGLWINTFDHARFGLLYLRRGRWEGRQIISESWIDEMTQPCELNPVYGYLWWLNTVHARYGARASEKTFAASGAGGNAVVIEPERDLVIVTRWCADVPGVVDRVVAAAE